MAVVCLDTNVLSWIFKTCSDSQVEKMNRTEELLRTLQKTKTVVAIPSIVLAETLCLVDDDMLQNFLNEIKKNFLVFPFNELAAYHYRRITREHRDMKTVGARWSKSADVKIIATAIAGVATCLYSEDADMINISKGFLNVQCLPPLPPKQMTLPISEIKQ